MWEKIISGVPPVSILGSLLFNIFLNDLFPFVGNFDLSNYADDNTSRVLVMTWKKKKQTLRQDSEIVTNWFCEKYGFELGQMSFYMSRREYTESKICL